jgi:Immunity protein 50
MEGIKNSAALTEIFDRWPSFHDAEVLRLRLDRGVDTDASLPTGTPRLEADVHVFEMTDQVTPEGFYELRKHTLVTLAFYGIDQLEVREFNHQNALFDLALEDIRDRQLETLRWSVALDGSYGVEASFLCADVEVVSVRPFSPPRRAAGTQMPPSAGASESK